MKESVVSRKSYDFAIIVIRLSQTIMTKHKEYIITKQLIRSGTSPGAMIREARYAESKKDFIHKMSIALKEIHESEYWLNLLLDTNYISRSEHQAIIYKCKELIRLLVAIVRSSKESVSDR